MTPQPRLSILPYSCVFPLRAGTNRPEEGSTPICWVHPVVRARPYALFMRQGLVDGIIGLLGFATLLYGLWLIWQPLAWTVGGLLLLGYALKASRARVAPGES